jgi:PRTRC genetic system protein C
MTSQVIQLTPVLKMGPVRLPFPDPSMRPEEAMQLYSANYPSLAQSTLGPCYPEGDDLVYPVEKPPVKTKG